MLTLSQQADLLRSIMGREKFMAFVRERIKNTKGKERFFWELTLEIEENAP